MKRIFARLGAAALLLAVLVSTVPLAALAAGSGIDPIVTSYEVTNSSGSTLGNFQRNATVNITLHVKDVQVTTPADANNALKFDVTKLVDSFGSSSQITTNVTSAEGAPLTFDVAISGLRYSGTGKSLSLMIGYNGRYVTNFTQNISEAVEYVPPTDEPYTPDPLPEPTVIISWEPMSEPIKAGQEFEVTIKIENTSNIALRSPIIKCSPSDSLMLTGGSNTFALSDIGAKKTGTFKVKLKAMSTISSSQQSLSVDLSYNYYNNVSTQRGSASQQVVIYAQAAGSIPEPPVIITRSTLEPISAGQEFQLTITYKNAGETDLVSPVAKVNLSDGLMLLNDSSTFILKDIPAGSTGTVTLKLKAAAQISSATQSVSTDLRFSYNSGNSMTQASVSESLPVPAKASGSVSEPVVIITRNAMDPISAKQSFDLTITFRNAGTTALLSPVARISTPNDLVLQNDTATFIMEDIPAGESRSIVLKLKASDQISSSMLTVSADLRYS